MICALTARRIAEGKADEFIERFTNMDNEMPEAMRDSVQAVYACRAVDDPNIVMTFGLFNGTIDEFRAMAAGTQRDEALESMSPMIEEVLFDHSFDVVKQFVNEPGKRPSVTL